MNKHLAKHPLLFRVASAGLACCLMLALTGCVAYGPCGPVYLWDFFRAQSGDPINAGETNECVTLISLDLTPPDI